MRLHDIVTKSLANKHHILAVFIDIEKACDKVSKDHLLLKLLKICIKEACSHSSAPFSLTGVFRSGLVLLSHRPNILPMAFPKGVF